MNRSLKPLFVDLQNNKQRYIGSTTGKEFEDRLDAKLHSLGYSRIVKQDMEQPGMREKFKLLKAQIKEKERQDETANIFSGTFPCHFIVQPYGSQSYPDFVVFDGGRAVSIEVKFSKEKQSKPVWNSGLPRPNGIYIFGSLKQKDVTFFRGCDIVSLREIKKLQEFFDKGMRDAQNRFNRDEMSAQKYGFSAYIRKAFDQSKQFNQHAINNYFTNPQRKELEKSVIDYVHPPQ